MKTAKTNWYIDKFRLTIHYSGGQKGTWRLLETSFVKDFVNTIKIPQMLFLRQFFQSKENLVT